MLLFDLAGVGNQLLDHIKVHQGLAAKEVYLQVVTGSRSGNQKIQCLLTHLKAHDGAVAVVIALACKAIGAVEVTGVGDVQAKCLDDACGLFLQLACHGLEGVGGKKLAACLQGGNL